MGCRPRGPGTEPRRHPIRSAETEFHLQVKLSAQELTVNELVEALERPDGDLFASLLEAVGWSHLEALREVVVITLGILLPSD